MTLVKSLGIGVLLIAASDVSSIRWGRRGTDGLPVDFRIRSTTLRPPKEAVSSGAEITAAGPSLPVWTYSTRSSRDGQTYSGTIVGADPFLNPDSTTSVPTQVISIALSFDDGSDFDPSAPDICINAPGAFLSDIALVQQSPIFVNHPFVMNGVNVGSTQYADAYQRANFSSVIAGHSYHVLLNVTAFIEGASARVPSGAGITVPPGASSRCGNIALVDINWFDEYLRSTPLPTLASPDTLPIFLLHNVFLCDATCGIAGYHSATSSGQTYAVATVPTAFRDDISILSHEVAEWLNNPYVTNQTPSWGGIGQVQGTCQADYEVADPLTGTNVPPVQMPNGYSYHLQELAFYSWFFGGPSVGAGGLFSNNGTLTRNALFCPPGGSNPLPMTWQLSGLGDFNRDGKSDLAWRVTGTGDFAVWLMNGPAVAQGFIVAPGVPLAWQVAGLGDLDGDGRSDVIWRQTATGDVSVWLMNGTAVTQSPVIAKGVPLAWQIVGVGDLDGDGKADLIWRHSFTGDVAAWLMNGASVLKGPVIASRVPLGWKIVGLADLDGDRRADLIWRNVQSGDVAAWLMDGVTVEQAPLVAPGVPLTWRIDGTRDLDGDGKADIVWRQTQSGDLAAWLMDGVTVKRSAVVSSGVPLVWQILGVADFDGDGMADLLWRQVQTGDLATWLMNGTAIRQTPLIAPSGS